jgi:hypothetical protein
MFTGCTKVATWNGYYCTNDNLAMLVFESLDDDKLTRVVSPVQVLGMNISSRNVVNSYMDHIWDGFYPSLKRLSRFISVIQGGAGIWNEIVYTGSPPLSQKFSLRSLQAPTAIRIRYPKANVF